MMIHDENATQAKYMSRSSVGQKVPGGHVQTYKQVLEKVSTWYYTQLTLNTLVSETQIKDLEEILMEEYRIGSIAHMLTDMI